MEVIKNYQRELLETKNTIIRNGKFTRCTWQQVRHHKRSVNLKTSLENYLCLSTDEGTNTGCTTRSAAQQQKRMNFWYTEQRTKLKSIMLWKRKQAQKVHAVWFHLLKILEKANLTYFEERSVGAKGQGYGLLTVKGHEESLGTMVIFYQL